MVRIALDPNAPVKAPDTQEKVDFARLCFEEDPTAAVETINERVADRYGSKLAENYLRALQAKILGASGARRGRRTNDDQHHRHLNKIFRRDAVIVVLRTGMGPVTEAFESLDEALRFTAGLLSSGFEERDIACYERRDLPKKR